MDDPISWLTEDGAGPPSMMIGPPASEDFMLASARINMARTLPGLRRVTRHDDIAVFVAAGPSLPRYLDEIRERAKDPRVKIITSNKTHDYLIENGIVPWAEFIIDPKPSMAEYVRHPHPEVGYFIAAHCVPEVFDALAGYRVCRVGVGQGADRQEELDALLLSAGPTEILMGGGMTPLRSMCLVEVLGFQREEFYAFDSCFESYESVYGYDKKRPAPEDIFEAETPDGRKWLTTEAFASQARQYIKWRRRLAGLVEFTIHGDGLIAALDAWERAWLAERAAAMPKGLMSPEYLALQRQLHADRPDYGIGAGRHVRVVLGLARQIEKRYGRITMLDYGAGKGALKRGLADAAGDLAVTVNEYDPAIPGMDSPPAPADIVTCLDVLEHVEPDYIRNVLAHLAELTKKVAIFVVHLGPAAKVMADGRNAHILQKDTGWWKIMVQQHFRIGEMKRVGTDDAGELVFVCQSKSVR
mgnify:FL=1